jgi:hypothetical protein
VADGTRTHDHLDHNQGLYQLSYSHRADRRIAAIRVPVLSAKSAQHFFAFEPGAFHFEYRSTNELTPRMPAQPVFAATALR